MSRKLFTIMALSLCWGLSSAETRKWTSADDATKTFDGEFVSAAGTNVSVKLTTGKVLTFPLTKLSKEDQDFVAEVAKAKEAAAKMKSSPMAVALEGNTVKLEGKSLKKHDILEKKAPQYYLLYWGASW